jgi:hypothetical protein
MSGLMQRAMTKLGARDRAQLVVGARDRAQLVVMASQSGLVRSSPPTLCTRTTPRVHVSASSAIRRQQYLVSNASPAVPRQLPRTIASPSFVRR